MGCPIVSAIGDLGFHPRRHHVGLPDRPGVLVLDGRAFSPPLLCFQGVYQRGAQRSEGLMLILSHRWGMRRAGLTEVQPGAARNRYWVAYMSLPEWTASTTTVQPSR
jgi:hypothetical protein